MIAPEPSLSDTPVPTVLGADQRDAVVQVSRRSFEDSEGEAKGAEIGTLVSELAAGIDDRDILCFGSLLGDELVGAIFFTRLIFEDPIEVYVLGPVAIDTVHQGEGVGTELIGFGLARLRERGVAVALTYGDPAYYARIGFEPLSESTIRAPLPLSLPHGWLGLSLTDAPIPVIAGRPRCVPAFDNPAHW